MLTDGYGHRVPAELTGLNVVKLDTDDFSGSPRMWALFSVERERTNEVGEMYSMQRDKRIVSGAVLKF